MKKEISNRDLVDKLPILNSIVQKTLPVGAAIRLARNIKQFDSELEIVNDVRSKLLEKFVERDSNGKPVLEGQNYKIPSEKREEFDLEMSKVFDTSKEYNIYTLTEDDLADTSVNTTEVLALMELGILE
jgi:hypothetical protein